jgi:flagellar hook-associated protein 1 FlgK
MAGLLSMLTSTSGALNAQQVGLETVGQNLANVNTPGYARRTVQLAEVPPGIDNSGGGVTVQAIQAARDLFTQRRLLSAQPQASAQATTASLLGTAQSAIGLPGQALSANLSSYFDAWSQLANDPTSTTARQGVVVQAQALTASFHDVSAQLSQVQNQADQQVRGSVDNITNLANQIASLNAGLVAAGGTSTPPGGTVEDQLYAAVNALSNEADISVLVQSNGQLNVSFANGRAIVVGANSYPPSVTNGPGGMARVLANDGTDMTSTLTGGQIGGALQVRDTAVPGYLNQLDTIAAALVQQTNTLHASGFDLNGAAGGTFFTAVATTAGAAAAITLDPTIAADPTKIAAAGTAAPGDNQNARAMANLSGQAVIGSSTFAQSWGNLMYQVGQDTKVAQDSQQTASAIVNQLQALSDATSGVSINDEAATLLKFQRAYQANAQYFSTVNGTLTTLFAMVGAAPSA